MGVFLLLAQVAADDIPGWFYVLLSGAFGVLLLWLIKREFARWDRQLERMVESVTEHDRRLVRLEARDNLGREIADAIRRKDAA